MGKRKKITAGEFEQMALDLESTVSQQHFERRSFKVRRIFATLAADGQTANLYLTPDEQELRCTMQREAFQPVPNAWGDKGWSVVQLQTVDRETLAVALKAAWSVGAAKNPVKP